MKLKGNLRQPMKLKEKQALKNHILNTMIGFGWWWKKIRRSKPALIHPLTDPTHHLPFLHSGISGLGQPSIFCPPLGGAGQIRMGWPTLQSLLSRAYLVAPWSFDNWIYYYMYIQSSSLKTSIYKHQVVCFYVNCFNFLNILK